MISTELARELRLSGLVWRPTAGDAFRIERTELESDVFTVSDMTIEPHEFDTGTILGFNGTTEWALDSLALEDALWLPREDQLRELLGAGFHSLTRLDDESFEVHVVRGGSASFIASDPADAYAAAVLSALVPR
ncbi:pilus assembly protein CpaE [Leifsonia sp. A12D58]|uniref:pilus assembly protein CpaE n=1 Tax=Leifsonia sp. A12D58 TaxID=3397674 RepID=UPI0039E01AC9